MALVAEKEKKIKEGMKMMGLRDAAFWYVSINRLRDAAFWYVSINRLRYAAFW